MKTRIKFCGMTRAQDVQIAVALGVDALGFVFVEGSARNLDIDVAEKLIREVPPFVVKVGLFMNAETETVKEVVKSVKLNLLQFHGEEDEKFCTQFEMPYLKAVPMASITSLSDYCQDYARASGFILDSHAKGEMGGSGETFAWGDISIEVDRPVILAGGLTAENVAEAIKVVHPYAVDVSSGIEAGKGIKDPAKMEQFIKEVHRD